MARRPNTNRWLGKRGVQIIRPQEPPRELRDAAQKLGALLDCNYYEWACTLENHVVLNHTAYLEAINAKINEIEGMKQ